ncbi:tyrosine-protein phosphatase [Terrarubrum flagellatum]|uniref:tyrosine-protein phosphatase n=1 Tax=Terrirubrum flagellatum TaxID=2895980 RepID=UPI0031454287
MSVTFDRLLNVAGAYNVRDLGGYAVREGETSWRRVLRADGLHRLAPESVEQLYDAGVRTVIDLRHADELAHQPNPFSGHRSVAYLNIPLFAQLAPQPAPAAPAKDALLDLYLLALTTRKSAIRETLSAIADATEGTVLFHCTAGKDRTGIIAALTLGIAGADRSTIVSDYALTGALIAPMIEDILAGAKARGADIALLTPLLACQAETMLAMLDHLDDNHGGVDGYLADIGLQTTSREKIRARLVGLEHSRKVT